MAVEFWLPTMQATTQLEERVRVPAISFPGIHSRPLKSPEQTIILCKATLSAAMPRGAAGTPTASAFTLLAAQVATPSEAQLLGRGTLFPKIVAVAYTSTEGAPT